MDAWSIERKNEIGLPSTSDLIEAEATQPAGVVNRAVLDAGDRSFSAAEAAQYGVTRGALVSFVGRFTNEFRTRNRGIDIAANGYSQAECRVPSYSRWDYGLVFTGIKGVKLSAQVYNLFNQRAPMAVASWLNGGGILPPSSEDPKGRMLRLGVEVGW